MLSSYIFSFLPSTIPSAFTCSSVDVSNVSFPCFNRVVGGGVWQMVNGVLKEC